MLSIIGSVFYGNDIFFTWHTPWFKKNNFLLGARACILNIRDYNIALNLVFRVRLYFEQTKQTKPLRAWQPRSEVTKVSKKTKKQQQNSAINSCFPAVNLVCTQSTAKSLQHAACNTPVPFSGYQLVPVSSDIFKIYLVTSYFFVLFDRKFFFPQSVWTSLV